MKRLLAATVFCVLGCMEAPSPAPPPRNPPLSPIDIVNSIAVEAEASTIETIFKYGGSHNGITISDEYSTQFGDTGIVLPAGSNFTYDLTELGGSVVFGRPKPIISTKVLGATVHPILDRILLRQPDKAVAYATDMFGIQHTKELDLPKLSPPISNEGNVSNPGEPPAPVQACVGKEPETLRPVPEKSSPLRTERLPRRKLFFWTANYGHKNHQDWCIPCNKAVEDLDKHYDDLPFDLVVDPQDLQPFTTTRPCFQWTNCSGKVYKQSGYTSYDKLIADWHSSCTDASPRKVAAPSASSNVSAMANYQGKHWGVRGMSVRYHLIQHHGFTATELAPFTDDQLFRIHSYCHKDD